jgi:hypothetical protein
MGHAGKNMSVQKSRDRNSPKAAHVLIAAKLASFAQSKKVLLDSLRDMYERGPKNEPFDAEKSWNSLTHIARGYLWIVQARGNRIPFAVRVKRLQQLAQAIGRARELVDKAKRDTVRSDLFRGWCAEANILIDEESVLRPVYDKIEDVVANLGTLERAARRAAKDIRTVRGRPKGTEVLPPGCVPALARI